MPFLGHIIARLPVAAGGAVLVDLGYQGQPLLAQIEADYDVIRSSFRTNEAYPCEKGFIRALLGFSVFCIQFVRYARLHFERGFRLLAPYHHQLRNILDDGSEHGAVGTMVTSAADKEAVGSEPPCLRRPCSRLSSDPRGPR
jgi:hypothetical protein